MFIRLVTLTALVSLPTMLIAQSTGPTSRGNALVGGGASIERTTQDVGGSSDDAVTSYHFQPRLLYFLAPRLAIGGTVGYGRVTGGVVTSSATTLGPEAQLFLAPPSAKAQPFIGASVARQWGNIETPTGRSRPKSTVPGATAGVAWMFTRQVGVTSEVFYQRASDDDTPPGYPDVSTTGIGLRFGFAAFLMR